MPNSPRNGEENKHLNRQDNTPMTELAAERPNDGEAEPTRKPFVEPVVSVPQDILEATAFFQGSAGIGGGGADGVDGLD